MSAPKEIFVVVSPKAILESTGDRIQKFRVKRRLTLDKLAGITGLSKGFLSDVENSKRDISSRNLLSVANALAATTDYLLKGDITHGKVSIRLAQAGDRQLINGETLVRYILDTPPEPKQ